jgi:hypothetical protein
MALVTDTDNMVKTVADAVPADNIDIMPSIIIDALAQNVKKMIEMVVRGNALPAAGLSALASKLEQMAMGIRASAVRPADDDVERAGGRPASAEFYNFDCPEDRAMHPEAAALIKAAMTEGKDRWLFQFEHGF